MRNLAGGNVNKKFSLKLNNIYLLLKAKYNVLCELVRKLVS